MERKVRVAYIFTPIEFGGSERVNLNFLKTVNRERFEIYPILLIRPWEIETLVEAELRKENYRYVKVPVALKEFGDPFRALRASYKIMNILRKNEFDLLHVHGYFASICSLYIARLMKIQCIATCHGFISTDQKLKFYNQLELIALRACQSIIAVSENVKETLTKNGITSSKIIVMQNAVKFRENNSIDDENRTMKRREIGIESDEFVCGYIGRLSEEKGLKYLILALEEIRIATVSVRLVVIGDGPQRDTMMKLAKERNLVSRVIFLGFKKNIEDWLPILDLFVLPSLTEGTPMALLEAMSIGLPVIATSVGGVPNIIKDNENGIQVQPADYKEISRQIENFIRSPEFRKKISENAINTIKTKFNIQTWCRKIENVYETLLKIYP